MQLRRSFRLSRTRGGLFRTGEQEAAAGNVQVLAIVVSLFCGQAGWAQTVDAESSWENLQALRAGQRVEVFQTDLRSQRGKFLEVSDGALSLKVKNDTLTIPREKVLRVSTREKSKRLRNILIGAAVGTAIGLGIGAWVDSQASESGENLGRFIGFLVGVGSGAGIGAAIPGDRTIYRVRPAAPSEARNHSTGDGEIRPPREMPLAGEGNSRSQPFFHPGLVSPPE
jgi:hypothetical protein